MPSTASQWVADNSGDVEELAEVLHDAGFKASVFTELPPWMQRDIASQLSTSFQQPYWAGIQRATAGRAAAVLRQGIQSGLGVHEMARRMRGSFAGHTARYASQRSKAIARTESANALNGARKAGMDKLMAEAASDIPMVPVWLSVLGNTTRDTHAALDGVPADSNGMWNLAGTDVPWPGHYSLPPEERVNCQCSIIMEFGERKSKSPGNELQSLLEEAVHVVGEASLYIKRSISRRVFARHIRLTEVDLARAVAPVIRDSIRDLSQNLMEMTEPIKSKKEVRDDNMEALVDLAFDEDVWTNKMVDRSLPVLAMRMAEAGHIQLAEMRRVDAIAVERIEED